MFENRVEDILDAALFLRISENHFRGPVRLGTDDVDLRYTPDFQDANMLEIDFLPLGQKQSCINVTDIFTDDHSLFKIIHGNKAHQHPHSPVAVRIHLKTQPTVIYFSYSIIGAHGENLRPKSYQIDSFSDALRIQTPGGPHHRKTG
jgi:hypothetical protein